ncbi:hypothetical protein F511_23824 [Dorcoceras hygrometricum]|uniref:Uncharacterized protein n=1 Tax=Dorcoceras hygrometricum TaxID=472368 RepID=A0A2Z7C1A0_9LAMI|nr:hypothetical protein F511_23824 [Dorcoceras hygrometricum]
MWTQRQHQQSDWTGVTISTQPDPIPATTIELNEVPADQIPQEGGTDHFDGQMEVNAPTEQEGHNDQGVTTDSRDGSPHNSIPIISNKGKGDVADNEQMGTGSEDLEKAVSTKDVQLNVDTTSVDEHCRQLIESARNKVSAQLATFDDWIHFRLEVRLKEISSFELMVNTEEQLIEWAETENVTELSERRSLIQYKFLELDLEKLYLMHLANFKAGVASVNYDFECIRRLHTELRLIAAADRNHRGLVGLPFINPEFDFLPKQVNEATAITSHEHQAHKNEPLIQIVKHAHQDHDEQGFIERVDQALVNCYSSTGISYSPASKYGYPDSLDQSYARIRDDTTITRHHNTKLCDELKSTAEGFDIRIDVLERTLTQRMVDELAVVKSQLAAIVEDLKETGAAKNGEGGSSSRPREGPSGGGLSGGRGGSSSRGGRGRGRGRSDDRTIQATDLYIQNGLKS